jgi:hypothetical protein
LTEKTYKKICRHCKQQFKTTTPNQQYCNEEHRKTARRENQRKYNKAYRQKQKQQAKDINKTLLSISNKGTLSKLTHSYSTTKYLPIHDHNIFSILILKTETAPCPQCKTNNRINDVKRKENSCPSCGYVYTPDDFKAKMTPTERDVSRSQETRDDETGKPIDTPFDIAWKRYKTYNPLDK